jgi:hypothetical protein
MRLLHVHSPRLTKLACLKASAGASLSRKYQLRRLPADRRASILARPALSEFLAPLGVGFLMWISALAALPWKFGYLIPYTCSMLDYLRHDPGKAFIPTIDIQLFALGYAVMFTAVGYALYLGDERERYRRSVCRATCDRQRCSFPSSDRLRTFILC